MYAATTGVLIYYCKNNFILCFQEMFTEIIFPLMCHSDEDAALWLEDPQEYIRVKYGKSFKCLLDYFFIHLLYYRYLKLLGVIESGKNERWALFVVVENCR